MENLQLRVLPMFTKRSKTKWTLNTRQAARIIAGIRITDEKLDLLLEKYDLKTVVFRQLYKDLQNLNPCTNYHDAQEFQLKLEQICRNLIEEGEGAELECKFLSKCLFSKLTKPLMREMEKARELLPVWNTTAFRRELKKLIKSEVNLEDSYKKEHGGVSKKPEVKEKKATTEEKT